MFRKFYSFAKNRISYNTGCMKTSPIARKNIHANIMQALTSCSSVQRFLVLSSGKWMLKRFREKERMVSQKLGLVFCVCFLPLSCGLSEKVNVESTCSNDACYTVHLNKTAFTDAHVECTNRGGDLVTIQNEEEAGHVHSLLWKLTNIAPLVRPLKLWIGLQLKLKSCVVRNETLKGFSWITDNEDAKEGQFSNWLTEPKATCTKRKCVSMKLQKDSPDNYRWSDELCSFHADGYICKFNFQGMCQRVVLAGPGSAEYDTPFGFKSSSLDLVPHGSSASVSCGNNGEHTGPLLLCLKSDETNVYQWGNSRLDKKSNGPFCASEELGCKYKNGGCEHECVEFPQNKSLSCRCKDGYALAPDLVSCVPPDHCQSNPCEQKCINHQYGFECSCFNGFALADNQVSCYNIKGCLKGECDPRIINGYKTEELESESNDTTSSILKENEPHQTTPHTFIDGQNDNGNTPKVTQPTLKPSVKTASPGANGAADCNALRPRSELILSILCIRAVFYS